MSHARVSDEQIVRARAVPLDRLIKLDRRDFACCPFHAEKTASFHVMRATNCYKCFGCGAGGDAISLVMGTRGLDFAAAVRELCGGLDRLGVVDAQRRPQRSSAVDRAHHEKILSLWNAPDDARLRELYFYSRGIGGVRVDDVHGHRAVWCAEAQERLPAVIAGIRDSSGKVCAIQRIWCKTRLEYISGQGPKDARADLSDRKKSWGPMLDGCVRLRQAAPIMGIAEGVETACAAMQLWRMPVWATCGLSRWGHPEPPRAPSIWIPPETERLYLFADNGEVAHRVADFAARWYRRQGLPCEAVYPDEKFSDWNDVLLA